MGIPDSTTDSRHSLSSAALSSASFENIYDPARKNESTNDVIDNHTDTEIDDHDNDHENLDSNNNNENNEAFNEKAAEKKLLPWYRRYFIWILIFIVALICSVLIGVLGGVLGHRTAVRDRHPSYKAKTYSLVKEYKGTTFFDGFDFMNITDPTHGFVQYLDRNSSAKLGLISANSSNVIMAADSKHNYSSGRPSIRLQSTQYFEHGLFILDLIHLPYGCGTWPAFWTLGDDWPNGGEIDIVEGVNVGTSNQVTLHTGDGCEMEDIKRVMTGTALQTNCWVDAPNSYNAGCGVENPSGPSYGEAFNKNGGGVFVLDWRSEGIRSWFFNRSEIPSDITSGSPQPAKWSEPVADFPDTKCDIDKMFSKQKILFDLTFCGDWAGSSVYSSAGCPGSCNDFVGNNPHNFTEAYWNIKSLAVYQY
ncbi:putative glycosidase C21B10.07 [Schizosaccharomyces pombe]|uniref:Probable glycosidase C21B10.07 n=1 Tax=Schizosaccharomyces pombe (strain 972 / ATCC 24843) TaxID=284812 RepID=YHZ7_SCHPO|nr:putative glycosyl hydrolase family 16 [Schizosaccharomyces pombe]Q9USW3.1 RecName: Full=Probable glycosidase C21B10.07 [Schizosaccharomyces pombe 972h-]CAB57923.1 glycosyl hydrolase family 16 (predicted) [Schizosaccharomyces pombe]|eukprot:NP_595680.1 putative glycosyl hydrolase family 16 [Schizosaccharomyces pombe]